MAIKKITDQEIRDNQVQGNLPDRPSQKTLYGDRAMTPDEVKSAFDKLPKLIAERFNNLISSIAGMTGDELDDDSLAAMILTGIEKGHTLKDLFKDIIAGRYERKSMYYSFEDGYPIRYGGYQVSLVKLPVGHKLKESELILCADGDLLQVMSISEDGLTYNAEPLGSLKGKEGAAGSNVFYSTMALTPADTGISTNTLIPSVYPNIGDKIITSNGLLFQATGSSAGICFVSYLSTLSGTILPTFSSTADNGKFLRIVDGNIAWQTIDTAEEVAL